MHLLNVVEVTVVENVSNDCHLFSLGKLGI